MSSKYYFLLSSLPMLKMGEVPGITANEFLSYCSEFIHDDKWDLLKSLTLIPSGKTSFSADTLVGKYYHWEIALRNSIVRLRSANLGSSFEQFIRPEADFEVDANRSATAAYSVENPLERERILDRERWTKIEDLEQKAAVFSYEIVCAYYLKLQLVLKWSTRNPEQAGINLEQAAGAVYRSCSGI